MAKRNQVSEEESRHLGNVITIDDERIKSHLDLVMRGSVEETLNALDANLMPDAAWQRCALIEMYLAGVSVRRVEDS